MNNSKIQLSAEEMQLINNTDWILTKHGIIKKIYCLFGALAEDMQLHMSNLPNAVNLMLLLPAPKISKGEQYEQLPYVVLDYPRHFSKDDVFAIRTFFWWGNFFTITLHIKGKYQHQFAHKINKAIYKGQLNGYYLSVTGNEFNFNVDGEDYFIIENNENKKAFAVTLTQQMPFYKISYKISLSHWNTAQEKILAVYKNITEIIFS